jgi:prephenate dehydrogenase
MFDKVAIIGTGLIGGSMGMALRHRGLAGTVVGIGRRRSSVELAEQVGAVDSGTLDLAEGLESADLVVLATPIAALDALAPRVAKAAAPGAILTDVASSKATVIQTISGALSERADMAYVPSHPMAGGERKGPLAASANLFERSFCILTPLDGTAPEALDAIRTMWSGLGASVVAMSSAEHDRLVARISHVPHLAAVALMSIVAEDTMQYCGGGLRDTTRIAAGDPDLWGDICESNRSEILRGIGEYIESLRRMADYLRDGQMDLLRGELADSKAKRERLSERIEGAGRDRDATQPLR